MFNRKDVNIVIGYDGNGRTEDQVPVAVDFVNKQGYRCTPVKVEPQVPYLNMKTDILMPEFGKTKWTVWMDADSILVNPFDELFDDEWDVALSVKEPGMYSKKHGSYIYGSFSAWNNTSKAKWFLEEYAKHRHGSDQRELHAVIEPYVKLDDSMFDRAGEVVDLDGCRLKLLDPKQYSNLDHITDMAEWDESTKILHFKGGRGKLWREYADRYCRV